MTSGQVAAVCHCMLDALFDSRPQPPSLYYFPHRRSPRTMAWVDAAGA